jgi:hypothetical protein
MTINPSTATSGVAADLLATISAWDQAAWNLAALTLVAAGNGPPDITEAAQQLLKCRGITVAPGQPVTGLDSGPGCGPLGPSIPDHTTGYRHHGPDAGWRRWCWWFPSAGSASVRSSGQAADPVHVGGDRLPGQVSGGLRGAVPAG